MSKCAFPGCANDCVDGKSYCAECLDHVLDDSTDDARMELADRVETFAPDFTIGVSTDGS